jgi:hypothetical protein
VLVVRHDDGEPQTIRLQCARVTTIAVLPHDSEQVLVGGRDGSVRLVNLRAHQEIGRFDCSGPVRTLEVFQVVARAVHAVVHAGTEVVVYELTTEDQEG